MEQRSTQKYDVFISFKNSDAKGKKTEDSVIAEKLYSFLTDKGLKVFYSNVELEFIGKAQYTRVIDDALESSQFLIAVGCSHDNLNSQWVRYEWESFINDVRSGIKQNAEVFVMYQNITINELPRALRQQQSFNADEAVSYEKLCNFILNATGPRNRAVDNVKPAPNENMPKEEKKAKPVQLYPTISLKDIDKKLVEQFVESVFDCEGGNFLFNEKRFICVKRDNPQAKLAAFTKVCPTRTADEIPLILMDDTLLGNGKSGFLLTDQTFYIKECLGKPIKLDLKNITGFSHVYEGNSKKKDTKKLIVSTTFGEWKGSLASICGNEMKCFDVIVKIFNAVLFGEKYADVISTHERNGWLYTSINENEKALECYNNAKKMLKDDNNKDNEKKLELYGKILELQKKIYGEEHVEIARTYNFMGVVCADLDYDVKIRIEYYQKALEMRIKLLGEENADTAQSYSNVGSAYEDLGDYSLSIENGTKALEIRKKLFGEEHEDIAESYQLLGRVYNRLKEYAKSLEPLKKCLEIRIKILDEFDKKLGLSYDWLGGTYNELGEYEKALEHKKNAFRIYRFTCGEEHAWTATTSKQVGDNYNKLGDVDKALEYYNIALGIRKKLFSEDDWRVKALRKEIAKINYKKE